MPDAELRVLDELLEVGFSQHLVMRALRTLKTLDKDALEEYCFANADKDGEESDQGDDEHVIDDKKEEPVTMKTAPTMLNFDAVKSHFFAQLETKSDDMELSKQYASVWSNFVSYLETNFEDLISLVHLGHMLKYLKANSRFRIKRQKPAYLDYNVPNLVVCPQDEVIARTLGMYMVSGAEQALPSDDECLYCHAGTTFEQIELFWKRLLANDPSDPDEKIYALINVQDLLYDQAVKAQMCFEKLLEREASGSSSQPSKPFVLCLVCSAEKEDKCTFVTSFNRYRKNLPTANDTNEVRAYLTKHFSTPSENTTQPRLVDIENDQLNARVITSDRAGVGKSTYITRLVERARQDVDRNTPYCCVSIKRQTLPFDHVVEQLKRYENEFARSHHHHGDQLPAAIYHIDIAYEVWYEVDYFLFNLLCLSVLHSVGTGKTFRRSPRDLFLVEFMSPKMQTNKSDPNSTSTNNAAALKPLHSVMSVLPSLY